MEVFYLHGFTSSPGSGKASDLTRRFAAFGVPVHAPDLNLPHFSTLTVTRMIDQLDRAIDARPPGPVVLVGSSLGGFVALHAADRRAARLEDGHPVSHLVLLAPAVDFGWMRDPLVVPERIEAWRNTDRWDLYHPGYGRTMPVHFALWEDAGRYDSLAVTPRVPTLVLHGTEDTVVDLRSVQRFADGRPNVTLRVLDGADHQLQGRLEDVWKEIERFLSLDAG